MLKKIDYRNILGVLAVFALVVSVSAYVFAGGNSVNVSGDYNDYSGQAQSEGSFGAFIADATGFTDVTITNDLVVDGQLSSEEGFSLGTLSSTGVLTDGYTEKLAVINLSATSSAVLVNPESETIWVYDASVRIQTATSTAISYLAGTSTSQGIDQGAICGATGFCGTATANHASILNTGTAAVTTALDTFFKADNQGTDTRDGSGTRFVVPVLSGEYLICAASTTPAANAQVGGQAVQCQFKYYVIED